MLQSATMHMCMLDVTTLQMHMRRGCNKRTNLEKKHFGLTDANQVIFPRLCPLLFSLVCRARQMVWTTDFLPTDRRQKTRKSVVGDSEREALTHRDILTHTESPGHCREPGILSPFLHILSPFLHIPSRLSYTCSNDNCRPCKRWRKENDRLCDSVTARRGKKATLIRSRACERTSPLPPSPTISSFNMQMSYTVATHRHTHKARQ
jgi:hypothetical protein